MCQDHADPTRAGALISLQILLRRDFKGEEPPSPIWALRSVSPRPSHPAPCSRAAQSLHKAPTETLLALITAHQTPHEPVSHERMKSALPRGGHRQEGSGRQEPGRCGLSGLLPAATGGEGGSTAPSEPAGRGQDICTARGTRAGWAGDGGLPPSSQSRHQTRAWTVGNGVFPLLRAEPLADRWRPFISHLIYRAGQGGLVCQVLLSQPSALETTRCRKRQWERVIEKNL